MKNESSSMEEGPVEKSVSERGSLIEIIVNIVLLSAGVNILVTNSTTIQIVVGIVFIVASLLLIIRGKILKIEESLQFVSGIPYSESENRLFEIPEYDISRRFKRNMKAALAEDDDIKAVWENRPLSEHRHPMSKNDNNGASSLLLIEEMLEYIMLSRLSIISEDYFNGRSIEVENYNRNEMPDMLLENRFVELFSKPMENRAAFQEQMAKNDDDDSDLPDRFVNGETIMATGKDGARFEKFTLTLPEDCQIFRGEDGSVVINSKKLKLEISTSFDGFNTILDSDVLLLDEETDRLNSHLKKANVSIDVEIGYLSIFRDISDEYEWVDEYIQEVSNSVSLERYKEDMEISQLKIAAKLTSDELKRQEDTDTLRYLT